ncbi:hypothetical protein [Microbacterium dauci]|uniref:Phage portal protein n=1 Tax=Microbacterium dauci TaxID=3048008 RepID=A0ABT6ZGW2_9MICO|nr:hypothetical protein [Microbacterium sp. LX3-4]MDJ1115391.1 hypothetical protein [Microbacterium sp. LX3-4]
MGLWNWLVQGTWNTPAPVSPFSPQDSLETAIVGELFGVDPRIVTVDTAMRVPGLKRAIQMHQDVVSTMPLVQYDGGGVRSAEQPGWLQSSASGVPPLVRTKGLVKDLALGGQALLGCQLEDDRIVDAIHIPQAFWKITNAQLEVQEAIDAKYRQRLIYIPLGDSGILQDGVDTIRQARALDLARLVRLSSPPAGTELHLTDARFDEMTRKQKQKLARDYSQTRTETSVSVTPSYVEVKEHGDKAVDLFADATNSIRLDLANHCAVPAAAIEGAKAGGGGDMSYSNTSTERSELWDLGSRRYADAIAARLSLDDVSAPGTYVAFDVSDAFTTPTPTTAPVRED